MPFVSRLTALRLADPARFRHEMLAALEASRGNVTHAGAMLGAPYRTMRRLLAREPELDSFARRARELVTADLAQRLLDARSLGAVGTVRPMRDPLETQLHNLRKTYENPENSAMTFESESASVARQ